MKKHIAMLCAVLLTALAAFAPGAAAAGPALTATEVARFSQRHRAVIAHKQHHRCRHRSGAGPAEHERGTAPGIHHQGDDAGPCL